MRFNLHKSEFVRHAFTLSAGTTLAQVIPIIAAPFLTRLYAPADFGVFATILAFSSAAVILATGRYEHSIVIPKLNADAASIVLGIIGIAIIVSSGLAVVFVLAQGVIVELFKITISEVWISIVPAIVLLLAVQSSLSYWATRNKKFRRLALSRIVTSGFTAVSSLLLGISGYGAEGLIIGMIVGLVACNCLLAIQLLREDMEIFRKTNLSSIFLQLKTYSKFPKYSVAADFSNVLTNQLPVLLLSSLFGVAASGFYSLTNRVLGKPVSIISGAVSDVFKQKAGQDFAEYGTCRPLFIKTARSLTLMSILPFLVLILFAPNLFVLVFGSSWKEAGEFARILAILFAVRFTVSPLSYVIYIVQKQEYDLIWQLALLAMSVMSIYLGFWAGNVLYSIGFYSIAYSAMYIVYALLSYNLSKGDGELKLGVSET